MTTNETINLINRNTGLLKARRELYESQKRMIVETCQTLQDTDPEKIIEEMVPEQRRLF